MKIDYCLHSHTSRCGHASGKDEEYVVNALNNGIKYLGFSDHVFLPEKEQPGIRGSYQEMESYINSVHDLREKYKDQLNIYLGFECEWFDEYADYYKSLKNKGFNYLILGQHFFLEKDGSFFYVRNSIYEDNVERYIGELEKAMKSGLFTYIAHPDLIMTVYKEFNQEAENTARKICRLAKQYKIPLEINLNGMTWKLPSLCYPCPEFWQVAGEEGVDVTIGYDAHTPDSYNQTKYIDLAFEYVKKYNLKLVSFSELEKHFFK